MKICVLIPSYNEAKTIGSLVKEIKDKGLDVVVVDDGSTDSTSEIAQEAGAVVLPHAQNKGKGSSLKEGFRYILNKNYDGVITMDGDAQHSPEDISNFIKTALTKEVDMIVGDRMLACKNMPFARWLTNNLMSLLTSLICQKNIRDSQCGFRLIKTKMLKDLNLISSNYEIETEMIIEAHRKGFKAKFIPIQTIYRRGASQINPTVDTIRFFRYLLKTFCPFLFSRK